MHTPNRRSPVLAHALKIVPVILALPCAALADSLHPLGTGATLSTIIGRVVGAFLGLLGSISLLMFVWGGFMYMTASGNDEQIKRAKKTFRNAVVGLVLSFSSYAILKFVLGAIQNGLK